MVNIINKRIKHLFEKKYCFFLFTLKIKLAVICSYKLGELKSKIIIIIIIISFV